MNEIKFTITLADGTKIENLTVNGNNFVSKVEITADTFNGKLAKVKVEADGSASSTNENGEIIELYDPAIIGEFKNMKLARCEYDAGLGGYAFVLLEMTEAELRELKLEARLDYLEMLGDVE